MEQAELKNLLNKIHSSRIGIVGDFCLDVYLLLEPAASESSLETGLSTRPVRTQRYSLGAAGNVASNLQAMGTGTLRAFGVIGEDPFGREMSQLLIAKGVDITGLLVQREQWDTHVYMKPYEREQEQHRFDFGDFNDLHASTSALLLEAITAALPSLDLVIVNQQVRHGIHTKEFRDALRALVLSQPGKLFIADSRHFADDYAGCVRKINTLEASRLVGRDPTATDAAEIEDLAQSLFRRWAKPVFLTRGENGCTVCDATGCTEVPGLLILSPVDPVGAGDSMLAGIAAALAAGAEPLQAAELGSLVAGVTVQKLMQTGTATAEEILKIGADPDRRYRPDLAHQFRKAVYHPKTEIEIVSSLPQRRSFTHVIFDHDGTISTLRQGWELIMEPMMVHAILGASEREADEALHAHVVASVRDYIDKTTGMQTLAQMKGLVNLVRRFRCVPESEVLDEFGYKKMYNGELSALVNRRIQKLERGELSVSDCTIKNAVEFLNHLHHEGAVLYLASGTDREDLELEADILGYRSLFGDRIYGAVGDVSFEAKRIVLEKILADIGNKIQEKVLTFGDGPVEIRETHKKGGYTIGVASDEVRRYGLNIAKRTRLIEAGADLIVPDYSQMNQLLEILFG
ncbi:MAG: PfkB family carbohydrate kinase [Bacteroidota bacterium]|jgi:bifunctional ADP-heptose synthase (sugar kinase/adenylyltransferase)/phosphoglycolate phosphatase-like HAD superfamily hydrolase